MGRKYGKKNGCIIVFVFVKVSYLHISTLNDETLLILPIQGHAYDAGQARFRDSEC